MISLMPSSTTKNSSIIVALVALFIIAGYGQYRIFNLKNTVTDLQNKTVEDNATILSLKKELATTTNQLNIAIDENNSLADRLEAADKQNDTFSKQVKRITRTVDNLEKLSKTDEELLQKYSKIYFLNEHYIPSELSDIATKYLYSKDKPIQIHSKVEPFLREMLDDAADDGVDLKIISAYRSFGTQAVLKSSYRITFGTTVANQFSADQGYSEHQLGTTVDLTTAAVGATFTSFENTPSYTWLQKNAYKYGFVLSYPENNAYYQFEPWHWRFVGEDLARSLKRKGINFYDTDQREIDEYLGKIFD